MAKATKQSSKKRKSPCIDPVHRWIRASAKTWAAIKADNGDDQARFWHLYKDDWALIDTIAAHRPTTMAGLTASLRLFQSRIGIEAMRDDNRMRAILGNLAVAAEQIERRGHSRTR